jgi:uncharacterized membrane protein SpoIIM required for sporulation
MNNKLVFVISFVIVFIILAITPAWTLSVNAQADSSRNESNLTGTRDGSTSGAKTTFIGNNSSIITPWNTGNDRNNGSASSIG